MTIKEIKENYPEIYEISDKKAISWIIKNKKELKEHFKSAFPRSPYDFVAQFKTKRGTLLLNSEGEIKSTGKVSYLSVEYLSTELECPISI